MRSRLALLSLLLASTVTAAAGSEYRPVRCTERRPYEGGPLYSKSVELPPSDFALGGAEERRAPEPWSPIPRRTVHSSPSRSIRTDRRRRWRTSCCGPFGKPAPTKPPRRSLDEPAMIFANDRQKPLSAAGRRRGSP